MPNRRRAGFVSSFYNPLQVPNAPTDVSATAGDASATVSFTAPDNVGGGVISAYYALSNTGVWATGSSSPISVSGLANDAPCTFQVWALNAFGPSPYSSASASVTPVAPIGLFGGNTGNVINKILFSTTGNATDFGDLTVSRSAQAGAASSTRGVFIGAGGENVIDYVTIATEGNATDFGDVSSNLRSPRGCSSSTRGVFGSGTISGTVSGSLQYITIATTGDGTSFGSLSVTRSNLASNVMSPTRGIFAGGQGQDGTPVYNVIDYVTIATTGNATDFGDLATTTRNFAGASSSTRGLFAGGVSTDASTRFNTISYITIASTGNTTDFGDLTVVSSGTGGGAGGVRAVFQIGQTTGATDVNTLDYVTIASVGNATDFGDALGTSGGQAIISNAHGGL